MDWWIESLDDSWSNVRWKDSNKWIGAARPTLLLPALMDPEVGNPPGENTAVTIILIFLFRLHHSGHASLTTHH